MAHTTKFEEKLHKLFEARTYDLKSPLGLVRPGPRPKLTRTKVRNTIDQLQDLTTIILARGLATEEFKKNAKKKRRWQLKGRGWKKQKESFDAWFAKTFPKEKHLVYAFWNSKKCVYVGRTGVGGSRPSSHFNKKWCKITRVDVYAANAKSHVPKLECLAVHRFTPRINNYRPSKMKWTRKCPLCAVHRQIKTDLHFIFRLKK